MITSTQTIALNRLVQSKSNARRTDRSAAVESLMASIAAHGLRQNLNVRPTTGNRFEVVAGGRRLMALKRLAKAGRLDPDAPIPCVVLDDDEDAAEVSLAENVQRQAMHPDDECTAFEGLVKAGRSIEDVAARFGVTPVLVKQRLRLANVASSLRQRYRAGELDLAQMMAFALVDDQKRQEEVYSGLREWNRSPDTIRRALTQGGLSTSHRLARFVGMQAYEAAGGQVMRNLFDAEDEAILADGALVEQLATAKLETVAAAVKTEGWSWVTIALTPDYSTRYGRVYPEAAEQDEEATYAAADLARAGARIELDYQGVPRIERGLLDAEAVKAEQRRTRQSETGPKQLAEALVADLTAHRSAALRLELAKRPDIALAATVHALGLRLLYSPLEPASCLDLFGRSNPLETRVADPFECRAHGAFATLGGAWLDQLPSDPSAFWDWCCAAEQPVLLDLLALLAALSLDAVTRQSPDRGARLAHADSLATVLGLDMRAHWTPATEGFFWRLSKAQMQDLLKAEGDFDEAALVSKAKKPEATQRTARVLLAKGWLPDPLRVLDRSGLPDAVRV